MTFVIVFIALSIRYFSSAVFLPKWSTWFWFKLYENQVKHYFPFKSACNTLVLTLILPLAIVGVIHYSLILSMHYVALAFFKGLILIYCLEPPLRENQLNAFSTLSLSASFNLLLDKVFIEANSRSFAVLFWFVVLGPLGAFLYRMSVLATQTPLEEETLGLIAKDNLIAETIVKADSKTAKFNLAAPVQVLFCAKWLNLLLDWAPVRLFTLFFALTGHFTKVMSIWPNQVLSGPLSNEKLLVKCGKLALGETLEAANHLSPIVSGEKAAIHLVNRTLVLTLILLAINLFMI